MIIWINGTFGAGKTTTGALLADRDARLRTFDPEWVGYMLRSNLADHPVSDFQHYDSWRRLTPVVADEVARATGQSLIVVQSVLNEDYWDELASGLLDLDHQIFHVVLEAEESVTRQRIYADTDEPGVRQWRLDHLRAYAEARPWLLTRADLCIDTAALTQRDVADRIWAAVDERMADTARA